MALRFQQEIEHEIVKKANENSVKNELGNIKESFINIQKKLDDHMKNLSYDKYFKDDTQQILSILKFYKEHQNNEKILKESLKYKNSIEGMIDKQEDILEEDFDKLLDDLESTLDENDVVLEDIKKKLKGNFLKLVENS